MNDSFTFYLKRDSWPLTPIVGYGTGKKLFCSKCNSERICIFFKPGFMGKYQNHWTEYMDSNEFELCDEYKKIIKLNYNPNWICKNCYNGGVVI